MLPDLAEISDEVAALLDTHARVIAFAQGARLFGRMQTVDALCFPVAGTIRVQRISAKTPPAVLYRLHGGECIALAMIRQMTVRSSGLEAVAETDAEVLLVPRDAFDAIMSSSSEFRARVFGVCARRIETLLVRIEDTVLAQFAGSRGRKR